MKELQKAVWHITRKTARYPLDVIAYALTNLKDMCVGLGRFEIKEAGKHLLKAIFAVFLRLAEVIVETSTKWKKDGEAEKDEEDQKIKWLGLEIENSRISQTVLFSGVNVLAWTALAAIIAFPLLGPVPLVAAAIAPTFAVAFSLWSAAARLNEGKLAGLSLAPLLGDQDLDLYDGGADDGGADSKHIRVARSTSFAVARFVLGFVAMPFVGCMAVALLLEDILGALVSTAKISDKKTALISVESWVDVLANFVNRLLQVVTLHILFAIASYDCGQNLDLNQTDNVFALKHRGSVSANKIAKSSNLISAFKQKHTGRLAVSFALLTGGVLGALVGTGVLDLLSLLQQLAMFSPLLVLATLMFSYWGWQRVKKHLSNRFKLGNAEAGAEGPTTCPAPVDSNDLNNPPATNTNSAGFNITGSKEVNADAASHGEPKARTVEAQWLSRCAR